MSDSDTPNVEDLAVDSAEDLNRMFPAPEAHILDAEVHNLAREQHPEWFSRN